MVVEEKVRKKLVNWYSNEGYQNHINKGKCEYKNGIELKTPPFSMDYHGKYSWMKH